MMGSVTLPQLMIVCELSDNCLMVNELMGGSGRIGEYWIGCMCA